MNEYRIHALCINETKLLSEIKDELLYIEGHKLYRQDRNRDGGGVAVYVIDTLSHTRREDQPISSLGIPSIKITPLRAELLIYWRGIDHLVIL